MRILFVSSNDGQGASEALWTQTAAALLTRGHEVMALAPWQLSKGKHAPLNCLLSSGVPYQTLARSPLGMVLPKVTPRRFWARNLSRITSSFAPDLIVLNNGPWNDCIPLLPAIRDSGIPFVTIDHGIFEISWPSGSEIELLSATYTKALANFFVSDCSRKLASIQLGLDLPRSKVVRNPYLVSYDTQPTWPSSEIIFHLACVARLHPRTKGQDILLEVLNFQKWRERNIKVHCYGDGSAAAALTRHAQRMQVDRLAFEGHVNDIEQIWQDNHALIMPSRAENMPLSLVEAMLCGRPAIVTDVGGNAELIEHGISGFIAESATVKSFDRTMEEAWQERARWRGMGEAAATRIRKLIPRHPEQVFADELESLVVVRKR